MMVSLQAFLKYYHNVTSDIIYFEKLLTYYSIFPERMIPKNMELQ